MREIGNRRSENRVALLAIRRLFHRCAAPGILVLSLVVTVVQSEDMCTKAEVKQARRETSHLPGWNHVYTSYKRFAKCNDKDVGEQFSYAIGHLLADDWEHVDSLLRIAGDDPGFRKFVLQHVNEDIPEEEAQGMIRNARQACPPNGEWLCKAIVDY
jgi:hypothetical protein